MRGSARSVPASFLTRSVPASRLSLSLLGVLLLAKSLILFRAGVVVDATTLLALSWQDLVVGGGVAAADLVTGRSRWSWLLYPPAVVYIALSVPVTRVLGSPLTWSMLHAAGGPLADSIRHYATPSHLSAISAVIVAGLVLPRALSRCPRVPVVAVAAMVMAVVAGATVRPRSDTRGLERNAFTALVSVPRVFASPLPTMAPAWRESEFETAAPDLESLRGAARGMNVVLVILESTAAQYLQMYGAAENPMPALNRLSESSIVFDAAYAVYPESVKGLYATLCGESPPLTTSMEAFLSRPPAQRPPCHSPARALSRAGYATALFHSGRFAYLGMDALVAEQGFDRLEDAGVISGRVQSSFGVDEASTVSHTLAWIDAVRGASPFFAVYMPAAGHHPYASNIPGPFTGDDEVSRYRNALHETDSALQTLMAGLAMRGVADRTVFVVLGDHGEAFGQHGGNAGHTLFIHDENVRVPYLIAVPGVTTSVRRVSSPVSVLDTVPTLMDLLGLPVFVDIEGRSLLAAGARIAPFFADYSLTWLGLRDACWKYEFNVSASQSHLYNVCEDPAEFVDRAGQQPARAVAYKTLLTNWK